MNLDFPRTWIPALLVVSFLAFDWILLGARARRAWLMMAVILGVILVWLHITKTAIHGDRGRAMSSLAVGLFVASAALSREMFLTRARYFQTESKITDLVRSIAITNSHVLGGPEEKPGEKP